MEGYIRSKLDNFYKIIEYHDTILGINESLQNNEYLNMKDKIFNIINLFSVMDENFKTELMKKFLNDTVSIINYFYDVEIKYNIEKIYNEFEDKKDAQFEEFNKAFSKVLKEEKLRAVKIMNTKLYYLDLYIWHEAMRSKILTKFIKNFTTSNIFGTKEFLRHTNKKFDTICNFKIQTDTKPLDISYTKLEIGELKSLEPKDEIECDEIIQRLVDSKKCIKFFKDMRDEDIKHIIKDVKFIRYKPHEIILNLNEEGDEIFFILSGTCRAIIGAKVVGELKENQIFGEFSPITKEKRSATVRANTKVEVISFKLALELYEEDPYVFTHLYKNIIGELIAKINAKNLNKL